MLARNTWLLLERVVEKLFSGALTCKPARIRCQVRSVPAVTPASRWNSGSLLIPGTQPHSALTKGRQSKRPPAVAGLMAYSALTTCPLLPVTLMSSKPFTRDASDQRCSGNR